MCLLLFFHNDYLKLTDSIKTIYFNNKKNKTSLDWEQKQVLFVNNDRNYYSVVYKNEGKNSKDNLEIYTMANKMVAKVNLALSPETVDMYEGVIAISSNKQVILYNYLGKIIKKYNSQANITNVFLFNNGKSLLIKMANKIYIESL